MAYSQTNYEPPSVAEPAAKRVLIADDNQDAAETLGIYLKLVGHHVLVTYDGQEAVDAAQAFRPDVAILDINMPVTDGLSAARKLRRGGSCALLIAVTGGSTGELQAKQAGFDHLYTKPMDLRLLQTLLSAP